MAILGTMETWICMGIVVELNHFPSIEGLKVILGASIYSGGKKGFAFAESTIKVPANIVNSSVEMRVRVTSFFMKLLQLSPSASPLDAVVLLHLLLEVFLARKHMPDHFRRGLR